MPGPDHVAQHSHSADLHAFEDQKILQDVHMRPLRRDVCSTQSLEGGTECTILMYRIHKCTRHLDDLLRSQVKDPQTIILTQ